MGKFLLKTFLKLYLIFYPISVLFLILFDESAKSVHYPEFHSITILVIGLFHPVFILFALMGFKHFYFWVIGLLFWVLYLGMIVDHFSEEQGK